jgi:nicotinamide-nucleotide amidase
MMRTEILTIGDEILIGQIVDTNSSWIAQRLVAENIQVGRMISLSDNREEMLEVIDSSFKRADLIIVTGGLGPTKDDLTKAVLAEYFESGWRWDAPSLEIIDSFFRVRNRELKEINKKQAYLPDNCETVLNEWGTAPGMLFKKSGKILVSLPGVPFEMQNMMDKYVVPVVMKHFSPKPILVHHFLTVNIPESLLAERLAFVEDVLPPHIKLAYLPNLNLVRLRLTCQTSGSSNEKALFDNFVRQIREALGSALVSEKNIALELFIKELLESKNLTLSLAESCTGGLIASRFVQHSGVSKTFSGGIVCYSNESKSELLGVKEKTLQEFGSVSAPTVEEMAVGCKQRFKTDYAISVSGIAGPEGGTDEKPVGTVYIGIASPQGVQSHKLFFPGMRSRIMERTFVAALNLLREELL